MKDSTDQLLATRMSCDLLYNTALYMYSNVNAEPNITVHDVHL